MIKPIPYSLLLIAVLLSGCATAVVPHPSEITLQKAMKSVAEGLNEMQDAEHGRRYGLIADEVTVTFNITATGNQGGELHLDLTSPAALGAGGKAGGSVSTSETGTRGNQVVVKFKNILLAPDNTLIVKKSSDVTSALKTLKWPEQHGQNGSGFEIEPLNVKNKALPSLKPKSEAPKQAKPASPGIEGFQPQ